MYSGTLSGCCIRTSLSRAEYYKKKVADSRVHDTSKQHEHVDTQRGARETVKYTPLTPYDLSKTGAGARRKINGMTDEVSGEDDDGVVKVQVPAWVRADYVQGDNEQSCAGVCAILKGCAIADIVQADEGMCVCLHVCMYVCAIAEIVRADECMFVCVCVRVCVCVCVYMCEIIVCGIAMSHACRCGIATSL